MDDLISRQAAIKQILLCENHDMEHDFEFNEGLIVAMNAIEDWQMGANVGLHREILRLLVVRSQRLFWDELLPNCGARMEET